MNDTNQRTMSVQEARWLLRAIDAKGYARFARPFLSNWRGQAVLAATDSYRLHIVHLGECEPFDTVAPDLATAVALAGVRRVRDLRLTLTVTDGTVSVVWEAGNANDKSTTWETLPVAIARDGLTDWTRAVPEERALNAAAAVFAVNAKYMADAVALASSDDGYRAIIAGDAGPGLRPIVIRPASLRWTAVLMPMTLPENWHQAAPASAAEPAPVKDDGLEDWERVEGYHDEADRDAEEISDELEREGLLD